MVRLKVGAMLSPSYAKAVSIPYGTIKRYQSQNFPVPADPFQFLMVRLKATEGKRPVCRQRGFNSLWYD